MIRVLVQPEPFDAATELAALLTAAPDADSGGIASFTGLVRNDGALAALELQHYPGMTERALVALANEAAARWSLTAVTVIHRHGRMVPGEAIVFVATASAHRTPALESCAFLIDRLKTDAPFWKREWSADGTTSWVDAKDADTDKAGRWD